MDISVIKQVAALPRMNGGELRKMYQEYFKEPPISSNKTYLVKQLAYRIQELAEGGMSDALSKRLEALGGGKKQAQSPPKKPEPEQLSQGARLVREWKGISHVVTVLPKGFEYQGKTFRSLSGVAFHITGTKWNGKVFFGLKKQGRSK